MTAANAKSKRRKKTDRWTSDIDITPNVAVKVLRWCYVIDNVKCLHFPHYNHGFSYVYNQNLEVRHRTHMHCKTRLWLCHSKTTLYELKALLNTDQRNTFVIQTP